MASTALPNSSTVIDQIFTCAICLGRVKNAQMCPSCSNMCCLYCIKRWLSERHQCPHCRATLRTSQLVPCRFVAEISAELEKLQQQVVAVSKQTDNRHSSKEYLSSSPSATNTPRGSPLLSLPPHLSTSDIELCPMHGAPLYYFCLTCDIAICSDCAMFGGDRHREHKFEHLSTVYARHVDTVRGEAANVRARLTELTDATAAIEHAIERISKAKDERAVELRHAVDAMLARLDHQLKHKLATLLSEKGKFIEDIEVLESALHEVYRQLKSEPKSQFIAKSGEIVKILKELATRGGAAGDGTVKPPAVSCEFSSEIVPPYEGGEFRLVGYSWLVRGALAAGIKSPRASASVVDTPSTPAGTADAVFSEPLVTRTGHSWRLKVYPNGNGSVKGTHLSVFLEMVRAGDPVPPAASTSASTPSTPPQPQSAASTYDYKVELVNHVRANHSIVREFSSEFEPGECWGYNRFARIDEVLRPNAGFLDAADDSLYFRFWVRPPTYAQLCRDLQRCIEKLEHDQRIAAAELSDLRSRLAREAPPPSAADAARPDSQKTASDDAEWEEGEVRLPTNPIGPPAILPAGAVPTPIVAVDRSVSLFMNSASPKKPFVAPLALGGASVKSAAAESWSTTERSVSSRQASSEAATDPLGMLPPIPVGLECGLSDDDDGDIGEESNDYETMQTVENKEGRAGEGTNAESLGMRSPRQLNAISPNDLQKTMPRLSAKQRVPTNAGTAGFVIRYPPQVTQSGDVDTTIDLSESLLNTTTAVQQSSTEAARLASPKIDKLLTLNPPHSLNAEESDTSAGSAGHDLDTFNLEHEP